MPRIDDMAILKRAGDLGRDVVPDCVTRFLPHRIGNVAPVATPAGLGAKTLRGLLAEHGATT
jgi:hypothetical protein